MDDIKSRIGKVIEKLGLTEKKKRMRELEMESANQSFWQDHQTASQKMKELSALQKEVEDADMLSLMLDEGNLEGAEELLQKLEMLLYFSGTHDESSAIVAIHSGQG
ncbi:MAG: hypothetical protein ACREGI_05515, partial [Candidatus Levyibacteriota bacterium]